ncbi:MAG: tetratricopeptide repeat protein, partial [Prosthecobacter sp.]|nr:tetratricopeptide repeat protein [Prosthecobacter sp.]
NVAVAQGNLDQAARLYGDVLKLREKLAQSDPGNTQWQHDLAASLYKLGNLHQRQGQWAEALPYRERCQSISERLSARDPTNATWKKDVQVSREAVQQVREKLGLEK